MRPATEAAKNVRAAIKAAAKATELGTYPDRITFSVRTDYYGGGSSVDIFINDAPEDWALTRDPEFAEPGHDGVLSDEVRALGGKLAAIVGAHRNGLYFTNSIYVLGGLVVDFDPRPGRTV